MKEHLESFLQEVQGLNPDPKHTKEVCFLGVQCMEVIMTLKYSSYKFKD